MKQKKLGIHQNISLATMMRKAKLAILLTICVFTFLTLSHWENAVAGRYKPDWLLQKEQEARERLENKKNNVSIADISDESSTQRKLPKMYFGDDRLLWKAGLLGDFAQPFSSPPPDLGYITVDALEEKIYFMEYSGEFIKSMDFDGRNIEDVLSEDDLMDLDIYWFGIPGQSFIALDSEKVYWTDWSVISCINLDGTGPIEEIATAQENDIWLMTFDEGSSKIYWIEEDFDAEVNTIWSANLDGSDIEKKVTGIKGFVEGICVDGVAKQIYWIGWGFDIDDEFFNTIQRVSLDNPGGVVDVGADGSEIVVDLGEDFSTGVFVDGNNRFLYWFQENYSFETDAYLYRIQRANLDDEPLTPEIVVETHTDWLNHGTLSPELGKFYWTESDELATEDWVGSVWNVSLSGGETPENLSKVNAPGGLSVDTKNEMLYWTVPALGIIRQASLAEPDLVEDLITELEQPEDIAVDAVDGKIYWTENQDGVWSIEMATLDGAHLGTFAFEDEFDDFLGGSTLAIDVIEKRVYWTGEEKIVAKNIDGTINNKIAKGLKNPLGITVDSLNRQVYWTEPSEGIIKRSNLDGTRTRILISGLVNPRGIVVAPVNERIYWTANEEGGKIGKVQWANFDGTDIEDVIEEADLSVKYIALGLVGVKPLSVYPTGDVNGDFQVNAYDAALVLQFSVGIIDKFPVDELLGMSPENAVARHYKVSVPKLTAFGGERISVPISINETKGFLAGGVTLKYDTAVLRAGQVHMSLNGTYWKANTDKNGEVRIAFVSLNPQNAARNTQHATQNTLFIVEFDVLSNAEGKESQLILDYVELSNSLSIQKNDGLITVKPGEPGLFQNYPNPFNPDTWIPYQLSADSDVTISIYDIHGIIIRQLTFGNQSAGLYLQRDKAAHWNGRNTAGELVSSGVYFYMLKAGDFAATRKMTILK